MSALSPFNFISSCSAVTPSSEPVTLKSIWPLKSSMPAISVNTLKLLGFFSSITSPIAQPPIICFIGTPASIKAKVLPQVDAILVEPLLDIISLTKRMVYGKLSCSGNTTSTALSAKAPWPISRLPGPLRGATSPTEYPGIL